MRRELPHASSLRNVKNKLKRWISADSHVLIRTAESRQVLIVTSDLLRECVQSSREQRGFQSGSSSEEMRFQIYEHFFSSDRRIKCFKTGRIMCPDGASTCFASDIPAALLNFDETPMKRCDKSIAATRVYV